MKCVNTYLMDADKRSLSVIKSYTADNTTLEVYYKRDVIKLTLQSTSLNINI